MLVGVLDGEHAPDHDAVVAAVGGVATGLAGWLKLVRIDGSPYASVAGGIGFTGVS